MSGTDLFYSHMHLTNEDFRKLMVTPRHPSASSTQSVKEGSVVFCLLLQSRLLECSYFTEDTDER